MLNESTTALPNERKTSTTEHQRFLKARNNTIVYMAKYDHMNLREIGERFDLTRESVRRILAQEKADYPNILERRRNLGLVSEAKLIGARFNPATVIQHGSRKGKRTPEYVVYRDMLDRCYNPKATGYADYGGRGITVCDRWREKSGYLNFRLNMGERPPGFYPSGWPIHSIHRIDNDGPYAPENCIWATQEVQHSNKRPPVRKAKLTATPASTDPQSVGCVEVRNGEECTAYREDTAAPVPVKGTVVSMAALPTVAAHSMSDGASMSMTEELSTAA